VFWHMHAKYTCLWFAHIKTHLILSEIVKFFHRVSLRMQNDLLNYQNLLDIHVYSIKTFEMFVISAKMALFSAKIACHCNKIGITVTNQPIKLHINDLHVITAVIKYRMTLLTLSWTMKPPIPLNLYLTIPASHLNSSTSVLQSFMNTTRTLDFDVCKGHLYKVWLNVLYWLLVIF